MFRGSYRYCRSGSVRFSNFSIRLSYTVLQRSMPHCVTNGCGESTVENDLSIPSTDLSSVRVKVSSLYIRLLQDQPSIDSRPSGNPCGALKGATRFLCWSVINVTRLTSARFRKKRVLPWHGSLVANSSRLPPRQPKTSNACS